MHNPFTAAQWTTWIVVAVGQALVAIPAWKRREYALATYLTTLPSMAVCAMCMVVSGHTHFYLDAYVAAGYTEIALTASLFISILQDLRQRARPGRRSFLLLGCFVFIAVATSWALCGLPPQATSSVLTSLRCRGYMAYSAMAFLLALTPVYAFLAMAFPKPKTLVKLVALSCAIFLHATLLDHLLNLPASSPQALKRLHDYAYLLPLLLWFTALKINGLQLPQVLCAAAPINEVTP